jgi:hypothetical protein
MHVCKRRIYIYYVCVCMYVFSLMNNINFSIDLNKAIMMNNINFSIDLNEIQ